MHDEVCRGDEDVSRHLTRAYPTNSSEGKALERQLVIWSAGAAKLHTWVEGERVVEATHC